MLGWLVESIGQWLLFYLYMIFGGDDLHAMMILAPLYFLFQTILVPYTLLLNEDRAKKLILRSGWLVAMRSVLKYNQSTVEPQSAENMEMGSLNGNGSSGNAQNTVGASASNESGSSTNPKGTITQFINEACPGITPTRHEINISWPQAIVVSGDIDIIHFGNRWLGRPAVLW